jgi:hypothetical protein
MEFGRIVEALRTPQFKDGLWLRHANLEPMSVERRWPGTRPSGLNPCLINVKPSSGSSI